MGWHGGRGQVPYRVQLPCLVQILWPGWWALLTLVSGANIAGLGLAVPPSSTNRRVGSPGGTSGIGLMLLLCAGLCFFGCALQSVLSRADCSAFCLFDTLAVERCRRRSVGKPSPRSVSLAQWVINPASAGRDAERTPP